LPSDDFVGRVGAGLLEGIGDVGGDIAGFVVGEWEETVGDVAWGERGDV
jgi:hypothetical protein